MSVALRAEAREHGFAAGRHVVEVCGRDRLSSPCLAQPSGRTEEERGVAVVALLNVKIVELARIPVREEIVVRVIAGVLLRQNRVTRNSVETPSKRVSLRLPGHNEAAARTIES